MITYSARWIVPVAQPTLAHGTITIVGDRIHSVDPHGTRHPDVDLGPVTLIPGLVNAHVHLDLSGARNQIPPDPAEPFPHWLSRVIAYRRSSDPLSEIRAGLEESLQAGVTLLGDIASEGRSATVLHHAPLRSRVYRECLGLSASRAAESATAAQAWLEQFPASASMRPGLSPHAPYSVRVDLFATLARMQVPLAIHFAESAAEAELINHHDGPFRPFLERLGLWDPAAIIPSVDALAQAVSTAPSVLWVHANLPPLGWRPGPNQAIVYCPRTHAAFGHPPHPFRSYLEAGIPVALGTDGLSSNPDLDILAEGAYLATHHPDLDPATILRMLTIHGAEALGFASEAGTLEAGKSADMVALPVVDDRAKNPWSGLFTSRPAERRTMFRGVWRAGMVASVSESG